MGFDIRLPIGMLFTLFGALLCIYGAVTNGSAIYTEHSLGMNVNLLWGIVMLFFGLTVLSLTRLRGTRKPSRPNRKQGEVPKQASKH